MKRKKSKVLLSIICGILFSLNLGSAVVLANAEVSSDEPFRLKTFYKGDVNEGGSFNVKDYIKFQKFLMDRSIYIHSSAADLNDDYDLTSDDLELMKKCFLNGYYIQYDPGVC